MSVKRYRKKPVVIEAEEFIGDHGVIGVDEIAKWCGGKAEFIQPPRPALDHWVIHIPTLEGVMTAQMGDFIIKGVQGEFYPCRGDIFEMTYEAVES